MGHLVLFTDTNLPVMASDTRKITARDDMMPNGQWMEGLGNVISCSSLSKVYSVISDS